MPPRVHIVADDLTGALDSAATFAARGARVRVACTPADFATALTSGADVVAVATGTRDGSEADAISKARIVAQALDGRDGLLFKKNFAEFQSQAFLNLKIARNNSSKSTCWVTI